ncbi:LPXTG cell wall anchor domain-containing protein, partial [Thomasclavelia sp.]
SSVKTGDETNLAWALLGLAGASVLYTVTKKTRKLN